MEQRSTTISGDSHWLLPIISWVLFGLATLAIGNIGVCMVVIGPRFAKIFQDFGVSLPLVTAALIQLPSWLLVVFFGGWWSALLAKERTAWSRWLKLLLNGVSFVAAVGLQWGFIVAVFSSTTRLIKDLSG